MVDATMRHSLYFLILDFRAVGKAFFPREATQFYTIDEWREGRIR